jgi:hypothetical protein
MQAYLHGVLESSGWYLSAPTPITLILPRRYVAAWRLFAAAARSPDIVFLVGLLLIFYTTQPRATMTNNRRSQNPYKAPPAPARPLPPIKEKPVVRSVKYVFIHLISMRRLTNNTHRHTHLPDATTFDVFVGKGDSQWLFTIYEDVVTQRSKLFRVTRQQNDRWWQYNKGRMLVDEDPQVFSAYLHAVYFGLEPSSEHSKEKDAKKARFLTDLHLLADKLRDPTTANLAMDELLDVIDRSEEVVAGFAVRVYTAAKSDSPLRRLVRDFSKGEDFWAENEDDEMQDITDGVSGMQVDRKGLYHRKNDQYEVDGGWTRGSGVLAHQHLELRGQT